MAVPRADLVEVVEVDDEVVREPEEDPAEPDRDLRHSSEGEAAERAAEDAAEGERERRERDQPAPREDRRVDDEHGDERDQAREPGVALDRARVLDRGAVPSGDRRLDLCGARRRGDAREDLLALQRVARGDARLHEEEDVPVLRDEPAALEVRPRDGAPQGVDAAPEGSLEPQRVAAHVRLRPLPLERVERLERPLEPGVEGVVRLVARDDRGDLGRRDERGKRAPGEVGEREEDPGRLVVRDPREDAREERRRVGRAERGLEAVGASEELLPRARGAEVDAHGVEELERAEGARVVGDHGVVLREEGDEVLVEGEPRPVKGEERGYCRGRSERDEAPRHEGAHRRGERDPEAVAHGLISCPAPRPVSRRSPPRAPCRARPPRTRCRSGRRPSPRGRSTRSSRTTGRSGS